MLDYDGIIALGKEFPETKANLIEKLKFPFAQNNIVIIRDK